MRRLVLLLVLLPVLLPSRLLAQGLAEPASTGPTTGFGWPLAGVPAVDRGFEPPRTAYGAGHRGVDLRAPTGTRVLAAGSGRVSFAGFLAGRGVVTVVHAGGLRTTYEPVQALVAVGAAVERGALLGRLTTGHASCRVGTTCLHWGLLRGQTYLDPLALVRHVPLRLLPLGEASGPGARRSTLSAQGSSPAQAAGPSHTHPAADSSHAHVAASSSTGLRGKVRGVGAVAAAASLLIGTSLLRRRPLRAPPPPEPGGRKQPPVSLLAERQRRRAG